MKIRAEALPGRRVTSTNGFSIGRIYEAEVDPQGAGHLLRVINNNGHERYCLLDVPSPHFMTESRAPNGLAYCAAMFVRVPDDYPHTWWYDDAEVTA